MLDLIIISYKLSTNMPVSYYRIQQYPVDFTYNTSLIQPWWLSGLMRYLKFK